MAHREVTILEVKEVLMLWLRGVPKKRIAGSLRLQSTSGIVISTTVSFQQQALLTLGLGAR